MALNVQTFKKRTLTAIVFAIVMLAGLFINGWTFAVLFLFIMCACVFEFFRLMKIIKPGAYLLTAILSLFYIVIPILLMLDMGLVIEDNLSSYFYSPLIPCAIIFSIWINDTMAYIVGSFIGKHRFSSISPNKTWEGTIGGAILCVVVISLLSMIIEPAKDISIVHWACIAALCAVFGTIGDLLESKIKRLANVKDSGSLMPGHGGVLDRFDSMLIAIPFVALYVKTFL